MQFNFRTVGNLYLLDLLHNFRRDVIGNFLGTFLTFADINTANVHFAKGINHVIVKCRLPVNQDTSGSINDGLVNDHAGSQQSDTDIFSFNHGFAFRKLI